MAYLDSAVSGLMSRAAGDAVAAATAAWGADGSAAVMDPDGRLDEVRQGLAGLLGCTEAELAITGNASESLSTAAVLLDCDAVALEDEFASAPLAWLHRGRHVTFTSAEDVAASGGDLLEALRCKLAGTPTAKALLLSCVSYMTGHAVDIHRAGRICHELGVDLVIDATQALGACPISLGGANVSFLCAAGYKWLCAGPGVGVLFVSRAVMARLPTGAAPSAGWFSQRIDGRNDELLPHEDARRFHYGTPNLLPLAAMAAALALLRSLGGVGAVSRRLHRLTSYLHKLLLQAGFRLIGAFGVDVAGAGAGAAVAAAAAAFAASHITCVAVVEPRRVASALQERGIRVTGKDVGRVAVNY